MSERSSDLARALEWWRATRDPDLAWLVQVFSERDRTGLELSARRHRSVHAPWLAHAATAAPEDVPAFLDTVVGDQLGHHAQQRLQALVDRGPDPRLAQAALGWVRTRTYRPKQGNRGWWNLVMHVLETMLPHDFDFMALELELRRRDAPVAGRVSRITHRAPAPTPLSPGARTQVDAWMTAHPRPPEESDPARPSLVAPLLEQIGDDPDNDAPRAVLADLLCEAGDPRGDFLSKQLRTPADALPAQPSTDELHAMADWLGEWFVVYARPVFRRGFPEAVAPYSHLARLVGEPGFRTVRSVAAFTAAPGSKALLQLLRHPVCLHVQHLLQAHPAYVEALAEGGPPLRTISLRRMREMDLAAYCLATTQIESLEHLAVSRLGGTDLSPLRSLRVRELSVVVGPPNRSTIEPRQLGTLLDVLPPSVQTLRLDGHRSLAVLERSGPRWRPRLAPMAHHQHSARINRSDDPLPVDVMLLDSVLDRLEVPREAEPGTTYALSGPDHAFRQLLEHFPPAPVVDLSHRSRSQQTG